MIDLIVFPFLVACYFPVRLLKQKVKRAYFLRFREVALVYVNLRAYNPENIKC